LRYLLALLASTAVAWAGQEQVNEDVAPDSAQQASTPLERSFVKVPRGLQLNAITDWTHAAAGYALHPRHQLTLEPRTYYL
jgi:hypothetical protein